VVKRSAGGYAVKAISTRVGPHPITYLTNQYDANNRVTLQTQADTTTYHFAYTLDGSGNVTQTDVTNPRGYVTSTAFNAASYTTSTTEAVGEDVERTTTYSRDATSNRVTSTVDALSRETDYGYDDESSENSRHTNRRASRAMIRPNVSNSVEIVNLTRDSVGT
jgi:YD repeat-containing protein